MHHKKSQEEKLFCSTTALGENVLNNEAVKKANQYFINGSELYINFFAKYLQYGHQFFLERALNRYYTKYQKYPESILDIGCGTGTGLGYLYKRLPDAKIVGLDPSAAMLAKHAECFNIQTFCTDLDNYDKSEQTFDLILSHSNFRFWINPVNELIKTSKLLSNQGLLYLLDLRKDCPSELLDELCKGLSDDLERDFMRKQFAASYLLDDVKDVIKNTGIIEMELLPGVPELYEENQAEFFYSLNNNEYLAQALMDVGKGFKNMRGSETIFHISLFKDK